MPSFDDLDIYVSPKMQTLGKIDSKMLLPMSSEQLQQHLLVIFANVEILTERVKKLESLLNKLNEG
jgi:ppGpp synthetase/RelA/SpoT-type nucleotidyltranferase